MYPGLVCALFLALMPLLSFAVSFAPVAAQSFPALSGRVVDAAHILTAETQAAITAKSEEVERQTGAQLVVATVPDLQDYPIEEYGYRLGRSWGIGQKGADNGVILLVAPKERRVRIEVGYGLEPVLTDALSSVIIQQTILPQFRDGRMSEGIEAGFAAIARQFELPPEEAAQNVAAAEEQVAQQTPARSGQLFSTLLVILILILWLRAAFSSRKHGRGRKGGRGAGPVVIWGPGSGWGSGRSGGWGGGSGGGFGGGGGGFGGGGASGGW